MPPLVLNGTEFPLLRHREPLPEESMWMCRQLEVELLKAAQLTELQVSLRLDYAILFVAHFLHIFILNHLPPLSKGAEGRNPRRAAGDASCIGDKAI